MNAFHVFKYFCCYLGLFRVDIHPLKLTKNSKLSPLEINSRNYFPLAMDDEEHTLRIEAEEVVKEVSYAVKFVKISTVLPVSNNLVYLNLETKENEEFCVELSVGGFRVNLFMSHFKIFNYCDELQITALPY